MKKIIILSSLFLGLLFTSCNSSKPVSGNGQTSVDNSMEDKNVISVDHPLSLADYLIRVPGVNVDDRIGGTFVTIRGNIPLYVVDGIPIGHSYAEANNVVNVHDIDSVEVLKGPSETALYGLRGANGVIVIRTRRR